MLRISYGTPQQWRDIKSDVMHSTRTLYNALTSSYDRQTLSLLLDESPFIVMNLKHLAREMGTI